MLKQENDDLALELCFVIYFKLGKYIVHLLETGIGQLNPLMTGKNKNQKDVLFMTLKSIQWWDAISRALRNAEYPFVADTPKFTLAWNSSIF